MKSVLVTGVSSGIGLELAKAYLDQGYRVLGISRRSPEELAGNAQFRFQSIDLSQPEEIAPGLKGLLEGIGELDLVILNAGRLGSFGDLGEADLAELKATMQVNLWSNKQILDTLFESIGTVHQVVTISSGAAVNGNRGWSGYALSKAALNMFTKLYAMARPETHFCALAPGVVDTAIQDELLSRSPDERYPSVEALRSKRDTDEMPAAEDAVPRLMRIMEQLPDRLASGDFADIRKPPLAEIE